jgi:phospholipid/cholesterol/gamma-HCH transport system substrate-binding protein
METKANFVAVGAFVLVCIIGVVIAILWLTGAQYSQEYAYYEAIFKGPVTGLGRGTVTRYNGIEVGRIAKLEFDPSDPQSVIVILQLQPNLNIRQDSVASIESQGLTGGSYVEISGGTVSSPLSIAQEGQRYALIRTKQSTLAQLEQSAPELVAKLNVTASRINDLLNGDNRLAIAHVLTNLDEITGNLARRSNDIDTTLANANKTMANLRSASDSLQPTLEQLQLTFRKYAKVADDADSFINSDGLAQVSGLISDARQTISDIDRLTNQLSNQPSELLFGDRRKGYQPK